MSFLHFALLLVTLAGVHGRDKDRRGRFEFSTQYVSAILNISHLTNDGRNVNNISEVGHFGENHEYPSSGVLVLIGPLYESSGCTLPLKSIYGPIPNEPWIALMEYGGCDVQTKVTNAQRSNAAGVLLYMNVNTFNVEKMNLAPSPRNMSAVLMYKWEGELLKRLLWKGKRVVVDISLGRITTRSAASRTSILLVSLSFIIITLICTCWLISFYVDRFRNVHAKQRLTKQLCSAAKKTLGKIPMRTLKNGDRLLNDGNVCPVCIEMYAALEVVRVLPCSHEFHVNCIDPWLLEHRTCPMCKMDILKYYGYTFTGSQESILSIETEDEDLNNELEDNRTRSHEVDNLTITEIIVMDGDESS